ncbi:hypothetical protein C882_1759 [Caenispirillum salinarum AK4]|uniref:Uncharacterized protein n=1 Tax=Caenispirillum salinarum AK4 TaxID=1238182 RepID=K9GQ45_9PROT|nr:hypothetical protein [Caenispirillum salinarum]EKV27257.1 hypothetical protein C882_1759 [Caenispirillum salinarum AK4]
MAITEFYLTDDLTYTEALDIIKDKQLSPQQVDDLFIGLLAEKVGKSKRVFKYGETFDAERAGCSPSFVRSFAHTDWIDGESVVQAETSTIEEGFNSRFHKIEDDLDGLAEDVSKSFGCLADLRAELAERLDELRQEINRVNADLHELRQMRSNDDGWWTGPFVPGDDFPAPPWTIPGGGPTIPGGEGPTIPGGNPWTIPGGGPTIPGGNPWTIPGGPGGGPTIPGGNPWTIPGGPGGPTIPGGPGGGTIPGGTWGDPRPWMFGGGTREWLDSLPPRASALKVARSVDDPTVGLIAGQPARRLDVRDMNGKTYEVWSMAGGLVMTPVVVEEGGDILTGADERAWAHPDLRAAGAVAEWAGANERRIKTRFGGDAFSVDDLVSAFGSDALPGGGTLAQALKDVPRDARLENADALIDAVAEEAGAKIARDGLMAETLVASIGLDKAGTAVDETPTAALKAIPAASRKALDAAGVTTLGKLKATAPGALVRLLRRAGTSVAPGEAGRWAAEAKTLSALGRKARP